jgi:hypothetical protein
MPAMNSRLFLLSITFGVKKLMFHLSSSSILRLQKRERVCGSGWVCVYWGRMPIWAKGLLGSWRSPQAPKNAPERVCAASKLRRGPMRLTA